jgi:hypothetical protein
MNLFELQCFGALVKTAVSPALTARLLRARASQGARVAPQLMRGAEAAAASGATTTSPAMRRLALSAGQDARAATQAQGLATRSGVLPQRQALQARAAQDVSPLTQPMRGGGGGLERGYSPAGRDFMTGHTSYGDAARQTAAMPRSAAAPTVAPPPRGTSADTQGTAISGVRRRQTGANLPSNPPVAV